MRIRNLAVMGLGLSLAFGMLGNHLLAWEPGAIAQSSWYVAFSEGTPAAEGEASGPETTSEVKTESVTPEAVATEAATTENAAYQQFITEFMSVCDQIKMSPLPDSKQQIADVTTRLLAELTKLDTGINRLANSQNAAGWKKYLCLSEVAETLTADSVDTAVLQKSLDAFNSDANGLDSTVFSPVRESLTTLIALLNAQKEKAGNEQQNEEDAQHVCTELPKEVSNLAAEYSAKTAESVALLLDDLRYYYGDSPEVQKAFNLVAGFFNGANIRINAGSAILDQEKGKDISQLIGVNEMIRGAMVTGNGQLNGTVKLQFVPNDQKAEFALALSTQVKTKTVASRDGALVWSSNVGTVTASKSIYFVDSLEVSKAKAKGSINSTVTGIDSGRGNIGQNIATQRVYEEKPYSQAESTRRMEQRVATQLENEVNTQVAKVNQQLKERFIDPLHESHYFPRAISSRTTADRFYWKAIVGNDLQMGLPSQPPVAIEEDKADLSFAMHESCPNNSTWFAFSGVRISDREIVDELARFFPALGGKPVPCDEETPTPEVSDKDGNKAESDESPLWLSFAADLPVVTRFQDNKISIIMHIDEFEKDDRTYPELDIEIVYSIVKEGDQFFFVKEKMDVFPGSIARDQTIPARYQAIRTMIIGRLEKGLKERVLVQGINTSPKSEATPESESAKSNDSQLIKKGIYVPTRVSAENGWFQMEFSFGQ